MGFWVFLDFKDEIWGLYDICGFEIDDLFLFCFLVLRISRESFFFGWEVFFNG